MKLKALIFDLDGTLLDSLEDLADAANAALTQLGYPSKPIPVYRLAVGDGALTLARRILPEGAATEAAALELYEGFKTEYTKNWANKTKPYPGIPDLLDQLSALGLRCSVLSNKPHAYTVISVETLLSDWKFDCIQGALPDVPVKPDPSLAHRVLAEIQLSADEILYVGDTNTDMQTARNAQFKSVGVTWGFRDREELELAGADFIVDRPVEIVDIVNSLLK